MLIRPSVLCPVDFSDASRGALRYAAAIAEHFYAGLTVLAVNDRLLALAADTRFGEGWLARRTGHELQDFLKKAFPGRTPQMPEVKTTIAIGTPASEILDVASQTHADLIVMSTHGANGVRKMMFGSTTERVLRETTIPVILTPAHDPGPDSLEDWRASVKTLLVPVDLSHYSQQQVQIARGLAEALDSSIILAHVIEPLAPLSVEHEVANHVDDARRTLALTRLEELVRSIPPGLKPTTALVVGDPATQIARLAQEHAVSAVVMGLHSSIAGGPRMGTVTYRLLCQTPVLVVAWPPSRVDHRLRFSHITKAPVARSASGS